MYEKLIIFYFTGTGNALAATNWITNTARENDIEVDIRKITPSLEVQKENISKNTLIGFCYPTHGFNAPPVVIDFCLRFPKLKNKVFLLNTRAGMKLNKLFTPGLSGLAQLLPAILLRIKGLKIIGYQPMDLPSNWISVHPGIREKVVESIFERCERKTKLFAQKTLEGGKTHKGLFSIPIDILVSPISIAYYFVGRFALSKTYIATANCNSCSLCEKECPVKAIKMKGKYPFWTYKCESCMHCMNSCPQRAIETPHLFTVVMWWLVFSLIPVLLTSYFAEPDNFVNRNFDLIVNIIGIAGLLILFFAYRILHFLMRYKFFNWLITYTSLTKFKFWRRYFAPKKYLKM